MNHLPLDEWDRKVGDHLAGIRIDAGWIEHYVTKIDRRVDAMSNAPEWESEAIHEMNRMVQHLLALAAKLQGATLKYERKEKVS